MRREWRATQTGSSRARSRRCTLCLGQCHSRHEGGGAAAGAGGAARHAGGGQVVDIRDKVEHKRRCWRAPDLVRRARLLDAAPAPPPTRVSAHAARLSPKPSLDCAWPTSDLLQMHSRALPQKQTDKISREGASMCPSHAPHRLLQLLWGPRRLKMTTRSAMSKASSWSCVTITVVTPTRWMMSFTPRRTLSRTCARARRRRDARGAPC